MISKAELFAVNPALFMEPITCDPSKMVRPREPIRLECGEGWNGLLKEFAEYAATVLAPQRPEEAIALLQIKEKFGGLRLYWAAKNTLGIEPEKMIALRNCTNALEARSYKICEQCGEDGTLYEDGWLRTHCNKHEEEYKKELLRR